MAMRKRDDDLVFPNAAGIDVGAVEPLGGGAAAQPRVTRYASSAR
jgi:hypothetical protein